MKKKGKKGPFSAALREYLEMFVLIVLGWGSKISIRSVFPLASILDDKPPGTVRISFLFQNHVGHISRGGGGGHTGTK